MSDVLSQDDLPGSSGVFQTVTAKVLIDLGFQSDDLTQPALASYLDPYALGPATLQPHR